MAGQTRPDLELTAAQLLRGYAPETALTDTTDARAFLEAGGGGLPCVALTEDGTVGFAFGANRER
jgi:hypothetical protein